jgi:hypothetical protein
MVGRQYSIVPNHYVKIFKTGRQLIVQPVVMDSQNVKGVFVTQTLAGLWSKDEGQDIAEYAVMLTVISTGYRHSPFDWWECK